MNASRFKTKNDEIAGLFDSIAGHYDFLNHFLSFGIDKLWRKKIIRMISKEHPDSILDIATGTSDLAIAAATKIQGVQITGIDISEKMLGIAKEKIREKHLEDRITLQKKSAESMDFADNNFDNVMVAFGVRNFEDLNKGLQQMLRVVKPGRKIFILEFSKPQGFIKPFFNFYFRYLLPFIGKLISGNSNAYRYLHRSAISFPDRKYFTDILTQQGFTKTYCHYLSSGIATIYVGIK
ncbi:MAG: bifunctional demethylmenaquinone methyltransferase/2-methoxy-6-polyprenyl-1,4-benzoquinol methylase UbiE [Bacteroidales bacterium]|jgi:demethylmenaquinone methyltransferase/2-methoxy-6-polyprenyl-1,4-benzoquinol methylase|nr:bifunctional demethylmenaquinone methyltransferase/2-methoxy-6-polyprenyl-1,4-benzoquinol methylase UbiE [Bacteroidales bacterium]MDD4214078.1 bifunctional demethylmenaquinone methyltransferase/2-methoxy-6-polyprenyl-1,4-benzoquinol methylase UbiE [Bacteroidales bacterium]